MGMIINKRLLCVFGTRAEVIKMAPVVHVFAEDKRFKGKFFVTALHRESGGF
jgi:UDP-N-acetylglucosamine 2-epimerase (non-hydrolysing)